MTTTNARQQTASGRAVPLGDLEIYYEESGDGDPLVLLHGFGGCGQNWSPFVEKLSNRYRLIIVDLRGHGHSTNPGNEFTHRQAASDVFVLLDKLGVSTFSAMGISSGGMTLLHMATAKANRINKLVLISATTHFPSEARAIMRGASLRTMPQQAKEMYLQCAKRGDEQIHNLLKQFVALHENYEDMKFGPQSLSTISARTLIVHGDRDRFFPVDIPVNMFRSIPNSELRIIPGGGHVPIYDPLVPFAAIALRFLDE